MTAYQRLEQRFRRLAALDGAASLLWWDRSAMMPAGGAQTRAEQLAELKLVRHEMLTLPETGDLIEEAAGEALDDWQRANLHEMRRRWADATALEPELVEAWSFATSAGEIVWRAARDASDFKAARPALERVVALARDIGAAKGKRLGLGVYDALHDAYEPGGRAERFEPIFAELAETLPRLLAEARERQSRRPPPAAPQGPFQAAAQRALGLELMAVLGFDFTHGRLDQSAHPFCGGVPEDLRLTTRYDERNFLSGLLSTLHETGHALYEQGLPAAWRNQPVGEARGMSLHESQSLMIEMQICRSPAFFAWLAPRARARFGGGGPAWEAGNLYRLATRVDPGFIRVEADEITYPLHVIVRTRLERDMIEGRLAVADLPPAWNDGFLRLVGIAVPEDRLGCLQDPHWFGGDFGYFPTYTLGAMTAAQLFRAAVAARPEIVGHMAGGDFAPLLAWLREQVHGLGSRLTTEEVLEGATGGPLEPAAFLAHLRRRYIEE